MPISKNSFKNFALDVVYTIIGSIAAIVAISFALVSTPVFLYRWIVVKILAPYFNPSIGKAVTATGQFMAAEFIPETTYPKVVNPPPRCAIVVSAYAPGLVDLDELTEVVTEGWLTVKHGDKELKYPEFKQYIEKWMGFMFWKPDPDFCLLNHVHAHKIPEAATAEECENILCTLTETLVWKRFTPKQSPWEIHLVQNYRNTDMYPENEEDGGAMTVLICRVHHSMVDGFSMMYAVIEGLMGQKLPNIGLPQVALCKPSLKLCLQKTLRNGLFLPCRILRDIGYYAGARYRYSRKQATPWTIPDDKKKWKHYYCRSELIPMKKIKYVKNQLGVGFTTVMLSCLAAGAAEGFKRKGATGKQKFPLFCILPFPGHPNKLRNHVLGTIVELDATSNLTPIERLKLTDQVFYEARHNSQLLRLSFIYYKLLSSHLASVAKYLLFNRFISAGLSNFPGPGLKLEFRGRAGLGLDFCTGGQQGVTGVAFGVVSYMDKIRFGATTDRGLMEREELTEVIKAVERELDLLYEEAKGMEKARNMLSYEIV